MLSQAELRRQEYEGRINRVMDHIRENLNGDLRLESLSRVAGFSPYHFHRVFKSIVGETLNEYIRRIRSDRAAAQLINNPARTITEIAVGCGFSSSSAFAREFRQRFGVSASQFRRGGEDSVLQFRKALEGQGEAFCNPANQSMIRTDMVFLVDVREVPSLHVAYVRHVGSYSEIGQAFKRLFRWAGPRRRLWTSQMKMLGVYHDSPEITPVSQLRSDACVTVPPGTKTKRDVGTMTIPGGTFAVAYAEINDTQYGEVWDRLMCDWMPESGYQPDDRKCYELYLNDPSKHPEGKHIVEIHEPIRPL